MKQALTTAVMTSIEALLQVPGTQLQTIEPTLRQLLTDLKNAGITPPVELDDLIEDAAIAHAETMAMLKDCSYSDVIYGDFDSLPQSVKDEIEDEYIYYEKYGCHPNEPKAKKAMSNMLRDMFPNGELPF